MPADGQKLPDESLDTIRRWIESGASIASVPEASPDAAAAAADLAKLEERRITDAERAYWAFRKPVRVPAPVVANAAWSRNPIDAFLWSAMQARGLSPAPAADRRTLVRRAYLDVIGLPPTPAEIDAFVNDTSPEAWPRLVDRLLASPHYGERWARHWMDLVRYADSGGFEFDIDRPRDVPLSRLSDRRRSTRTSRTTSSSRNRLAGDEYAPVIRRGDDRDRLPAARPVRRRQPPGRARRSRGTTTLTFMGMTVSCARCHNHKFDPIPQKDYYRIQSVFFSTHEREHPLAPVARGRGQPAGDASASTRCSSRCARRRRRSKRRITIRSSIARSRSCPSTCSSRGRRRPSKRTEGQRLNVMQIERHARHVGHAPQARARRTTSSR